MKFTLHLSVLFLLVQISSAHAVIYGNDDRKDIYQTPWLAETARSVAVAVPNIFIVNNPDKTHSIADVQSLSQSGSSFVCPSERFSQQPTIGICTGFLVGDRYLVTAGHCMIPTGTVDNEFHPFCEAFSWYFDYNLKSHDEFPGQNIPANKMYGCKRVIRAENIQSVLNLGLPGNDFALIELDRPVEGDLKPLPIAAAPPTVGTWVYTIGHPTGLPAKFSGLAPILNLDQPHYFSVNMDTLGGNSGGPVFNAQNELMGILVSGYQHDYYTAPSGEPSGCLNANRCDEKGENCIVSSQLQRSNFVQNISTVMRYLPLLSSARN